MLLLVCMCLLCATAADFSAMKVSDLKAMLKGRGLSQTGLKSELISRLESLNAASSIAAPSPVEEVVSSSSSAVVVKGGAITRRRLLKTAGIAKHSASEPSSTTTAATVQVQFEGVVSAKPAAHKSSAAEEDELEMLMMAGEKFIQTKGVALPAPSQAIPASPVPGRQRVAVSPAGPSAPQVRDDVYEQIVALVEERLAAKVARNYDEADAIKDNMRTMYGVEVDDRTGEWRDRAGRFGKYSALPKAPTAAAVATVLSKREIQQMVDERTTLRRERRYADADAVRDELARNGVVLLDKENEWETTDGRLSGVQSEDRPSRGGGW